MKNKYLSALYLFFLGAGMSFPSSALAHRVLLFAWVEGGMVYVEAGFGSDKPAKNCELTAFDTNQTMVFTGKTDEAGHLSFKVPRDYTSDMFLELNAGPGHKGRWTLTNEEFTAAAPFVDSKTSPVHQALEKGADPMKIFAGIGVIFALALGLGLLRKMAKGVSND